MEKIDEKEWAMLCEDSRNHNSKDKSEFGFVIVIRIIAFVTLFGGIIAGFAIEDFGWVCFISAFLSTILWWALSIIVEACQKYISESQALSRKAKYHHEKN